MTEIIEVIRIKQSLHHLTKVCEELSRGLAEVSNRLGDLEGAVAKNSLLTIATSEPDRKRKP